MLRAIDGKASLAAILALVAAMAGRAPAGPLNPLDFPLSGTGAFPSAPGTYTFNTSGTPTLTGPGLAAPILGSVSATGVAVFDFTAIAVADDQAFVGTGSRPLALLSRGDVTVNGSIDVRGGLGFGGPGGGYGGAGGSGGPGGGGNPNSFNPNAHQISRTTASRKVLVGCGGR